MTYAIIPWAPTDEAHEIFVVVDPDGEIQDEITSFNNVAHTTLPEPEVIEEELNIIPTVLE